MNNNILQIPQGWNGHFITIVTQDRQNYFGEIKNGEMCFHPAGIIAGILWHEISDCRNYLVRSEFVIMPNHLHGILLLKKYDDAKDELRLASISDIIRSYKGAVTKFCNRYNVDLKWQSGFHDQWIKSEIEFQNKINYIKDNIKNWNL